jgi:hypothetical protein
VVVEKEEAVERGRRREKKRESTRCLSKLRAWRNGLPRP